MRVHVMDLNPGNRILEDVFNHYGVLVLDKGSILTSESIVKLLQHGIDYIDVQATTHSAKLVGEPPPATASPLSLQKVKVYFDEAIDGFESLFKQVLAGEELSSEKIDDWLNPLMSQLTVQTDVVSLLLLLDREDKYTFNHSIQVGMLSYYIATWLNYPKEDCYNALKAGYLHDIGKCMIPSEILNKPGKLTPEEYHIMKQHANYGYDIIRNSMSDELSALVALQHHEREDGTGYPYGHRGDQVHRLAKITAVADVYSAMTSDRVYQSKQELLAVLKEMYQMSFGKLSPEVVQAFIRHMLPNFIGKKVLLSSGEVGSIVMTNSSDYFRPLVRTENRFADLSKETDLEIQEVFI